MSPRTPLIAIAVAVFVASFGAAAWWALLHDPGAASPTDNRLAAESAGAPIAHVRATAPRIRRVPAGNGPSVTAPDLPAAPAAVPTESVPTELGRHFKPSKEDLRRIAAMPSCTLQLRGEYRDGMEVWARPVDGSVTEARRCESVTLPGWLIALVPTAGKSPATAVEVELREQGVVVDRITIPLDRSFGGRSGWTHDRVERLLDLQGNEGAVGSYLATPPEHTSWAEWGRRGIDATQRVAELLRAQLADAGMGPANRQTLSEEIDRRVAVIVAEFRFKSRVSER